jgi:hypothetical protein
MFTMPDAPAAAVFTTEFVRNTSLNIEREKERPVRSRVPTNVFIRNTSLNTESEG